MDAGAPDALSKLRLGGKQWWVFYGESPDIPVHRIGGPGIKLGNLLVLKMQSNPPRSLSRHRR